MTLDVAHLAKELGLDEGSHGPHLAVLRVIALAGAASSVALDASTVVEYCDWCKTHLKESTLLHAHLAAENPTLLAELFDQIVAVRPDSISIPLGGSVFLGQAGREKLFERVASDSRTEVRAHFFALLGEHRRLVPPGTLSVRHVSPESMERILRRGIQDPETKVRERALALAYGLGVVDRLRDDVIAHISDPEQSVRQYAIVALGVLGDEASRNLLLECLEHGAQPEATSAVWALARRVDGIEHVLGLAADARTWMKNELLGAFAEVAVPLTDAQIDRLRDQLAIPNFDAFRERHVARTRRGAAEMGPDARFTYSRKSS